MATKNSLLNQEQRENMLNILLSCFPNPKSELKFNNPFELLCAVVLSAQATDESVNKITPGLFKLAPTPSKMSELSEAAVGNAIRTIGLWKAKASYLVKLSKCFVMNSMEKFLLHMMNLLSYQE